ncbi:MAG: sugar ABC transporter permease [Clostridiales bacterium]|nr:sugar ABC transporter permease [Clostridiales bacterium]
MAQDTTVNTVPTWKKYNRPWYQKFGLAVLNYIKNVGTMIWNVIKNIPHAIWRLICAIGLCFQGLWTRFKNGDFRTKISYLIFGFGCFTRGKKQVLKGILLFLFEALFIVYMIFIGGPNLALMGSLGTIEMTEDPDGFGYIDNYHNSMEILIFSVMTIFFIIFFAYMYIKNTKIAYDTQKLVEAGKPLSGPKQQLNYALNDGYHVTVLALPVLGVLLITVLPLTVNILVAFTNYDWMHNPPAQLFDWTGFEAFGKLFGRSFGTQLWSVLGWTLVWAVFATFTNFFFGMFLAMIINKKSIKLKTFWRTCFVIVIAVPDFISLMMMSKFFSYNPMKSSTGAFNRILSDWFHIKFTTEGGIDWFGTSTFSAGMARVSVIVINLWRGMPFTMLSTYGILMNIPEELYESSRIDGAGPVRRFVSITFPYIMFVMGPSLITTFTGNINNFNVIFFLTGGGPNNVGNSPGDTDLLITWLYKLTVDSANEQFAMGSVIGIFTFLITSFFALIVFNSSKSIKQEDTFQ